jgi:DNA-directed RNA polymerase specialized sigma24 family protein
MDEKQFEKILNKIDLAINLLAVNLVKDSKNQKEKITTLSAFGFKPAEIAKLIGTTANTVSVALSDLKKKDKKDQQIPKEAQSELKVEPAIDSKGEEKESA